MVLGLESHAFENDTGDHYPKIHLHGRFQLDAAFHDEDNTSFGDGLRARRVRMAMSGDLDPRWSSIDLREEDIEGRKQESLTLGVNWYVTGSIRFMANVIFVDATESPAANGEDDSPTIYSLRDQYHF